MTTTQPPMMLSDAPAWILAERTAGSSDDEIRAALSRGMGFGAVVKAFARADDSAVLAAWKAECSRRDAERAAKAAKRDAEYSDARVVAVRPVHAHRHAGEWCRKCGGPVADGSGICECCE